MKNTLIIVLSFALTSAVLVPAFGQEAASQQEIINELNATANAAKEIRGLEYAIRSANLKKDTDLVIGMTADTVAVLTGIFSAGSFWISFHADAGGPAMFLYGGVGGAALATGAAYGGHKAFQWYRVKKNEIPRLLSQLQQAVDELGAAENALSSLSQQQ